MTAPRPRYGAIPEGLILAGICAAVALLYTCCAGCGGSALRVHATAASATMALMETAGASIEAAAADAVARCNGDDACLDSVAASMERAAGARDALIPLVHAYRDAVLAYGADETPEALEVLVAAALAVVREWDVMREALGALGVSVPPMPFPIPGGDQ